MPLCALNCSKMTEEYSYKIFIFQINVVPLNLLFIKSIMVSTNLLSSTTNKMMNKNMKHFLSSKSAH